MIDLGLVAAYFAVMLTVGWRARKSSPDSYWVAERRYGAFPVAASLVATIFGASSTVGIVGLGYGRGLTGAWWSLVGGLALIPFALLLASRVRRLEVYTLPDILREAYGNRVAVPGALMIGVAWCGVVAAQIVAGALLLAGVLEVPMQGAVALVAAIFVLYTFWGGQLSVVRTDSWQLGLFAGGLVVTLVLVARALEGGPPLAEAVPPGFLDFPVSPDFGWYQVLVFYPLIVGLPYLVGPDIYSRVLCARDGRTARNAALAAAVLVIPMSLLLALLGLMIRAHFPGLAAESALPTAVVELAPPGLKGIVVAGLLGAIMSSADTTLISASTILSINVVSPLVGRGEGGAPTAGGQLRITRAFVVALGLAAWAIAAFQGGIIASLLLAYTVFVGGVVLPTLASFWRERLGVTSSAAMGSVLLGGGAAVLAGLSDGAALRGLLGPGGTALVEGVLGPEYGSLLAILVSLVVLLGIGPISRLRR
ncbi:MAG: sodium:solute symporter family protein [Gemmatimonadota bacterium]|jgi:SSS family solute:Na+ symporter